MTILQRLTLFIAFIILTACGSHSEMAKVELESQVEQFAFTSHDPYSDSTTNIWYKATNPFCKEIGTTHGPGFPTIQSREKWVDLEFDGPILIVPNTESSDGWCNYQIVVLYTTINVNGRGAASLHIHATDEGPTVADLYCLVPSPVVQELRCRGPEGTYGEVPTVYLNLSSGSGTVRIHVERGRSRIHN